MASATRVDEARTWVIAPLGDVAQISSVRALVNVLWADVASAEARPRLSFDQVASRSSRRWKMSRAWPLRMASAVSSRLARLAVVTPADALT
jgi:hypothetical protein